MTRRPSHAELEAARDKTVPDVIAPNLSVLFCGFNPGLYSGATGHHFARPGNRFWPTLHRSGFTPRRLAPSEERELLDYDLGITNIVERCTARASELDAGELRAGGARLIEKLREFKPGVVAILGVTAVRVAFDAPNAKVGPQTDALGGAKMWVLPNPSGLNAHYQIDDLVREFKALRRAAGEGG
ncbi:MAG: G/U mismatch-specific DNA glycosylase [Actinomycetota bacterium]|nr:G/U mismatch-specific DNA glycosylase [Actinomycetota bacterium]